MATIEPYIVEHNNDPRLCAESTTHPLSPKPPCHAELILHTDSGEKFFCKTHAADELRENPALLAHAVIELSTRL
jgi:hypothetical protein